MSLLSSSDPVSLQRLREVRSTFLKLHKALLDFERFGYEQTYGQITSTGEFFRLVTDHEWFTWLRPMSQFIVQVDDVLRQKEGEPKRPIDELLAEARLLIQPVETGTVSEQRYFHALQQSVDVASLHAHVSALLK